MIGLPDEATEAELTQQLESARTKLDPDLAPALSVEWFDEGASAQIMHVGPDAQERRTDRTAERRHRRDRPAGALSTPRALGDARRTAPEHLRTILHRAVDRARLGSGRSDASRT
jgi:hypothetical protein